MDGNNNGNGNGQKYSRGESFSTAALMNRGANHVFDAPGGVSFRLNPDGYQKASSAEKDKVASFVNKWLEKNKDPAADIPGAAPLFGQDVAPHAMTFASKIGSQAKTYLPSDESLENNPNDALLMRKDLGIMECLEIRQRMSALLDWSIVPEDSKSPAQKSLAAELTKIVKRIKRFTEYRRCLMDAIWIGRSAIQHTYGHGIVSGKMYCYPRAKHTDATGWKHIHGDKVVFRYDDGEKLHPGAFADQMGVRVSPIIQKDSRLRGIQDVEYTNSGAAIFLSPAERQTIICHKHMIEDAEYHNPRKAGRIHGVGIRDRIYNEWFLKQELLGFLIEYMERSAGGIEIYEYPSGDEAAKRSVMDAAKNRMAFGRNQIFFPKPLGMDAGVYDLRIVEPGFAGIDMLLNVLDKYFGHRIKRYIIGQTLSTEADSTGLGSSVADFQKDSLSQIVRYDSCNLDETVTHELVRPIHLANWPETEAWQFSYKAELESDNAKEKLDAMRTAWEMGCGIPEKDVAETVGVSLDNPNEKMLRNASAGAAPGMANGMQFPAGTGFGNQVDAAHEHVKAAGEVKGLKDGVVDHVAGKLGEGSPSSPADGPEKYEREFSEADHPRDNAGRFTESSKTGDSISVPELGRRSAFDAHIVDSDDPENATVSSLDKEGKPYWKTSVPKKSLHQFHSDLTGDFSYLQKFGSSGNESIDAVISGKGKMIGKGDDSVVFETPDGKIVKASTTVPYHAVGGPSHLTPDAAMQQAKVKFGVLQDMKKAGISGIPDTVGIEHGDKFFTVQEKMQIGTPMNREQLQQVKDSVESMHKAGYEIQDELQVGIGPDGKARHYDLGKAGPASYDLRRRDEMNEVASLWKKNGQTWNLPIDEAVQKTEVAQRMAMRDISGGRPVRQQAKEMLKASIDSFNYHGDWDKAFDLHNWLLDNNIMDVYSREFTEGDHPRDEAGKFTSSKAPSSPAEQNADRDDESFINSLPDHKNAQPRLISETKTPMGKVSIVSGDYKKELEVSPGEFRAETFAQVWRGHEMLEEFSSSDADEALENAQDLYNDTIEHARRKGETVDSGEESGGVSWNVHHDGKGMMEIFLFGPDGNVIHKEGGFDAGEGSEAVESAKRIAREMAEELVDDGGDEPDQYARQMSLWDEEEHPRDEAGKFAEKGDSRASSSSAETLPDGKVRMKQAKAGGETSDVDGKFYKGGRLMPVHGLYSGREKPAPKPKKENPFGSLPVASEDGKGLPSARKRTDEQIEQERQEMADKAAWLSVQSGPVRDMVWVGDKPGKTGYEVKKQLVPFLSGLSDEQVQQIGEFAFQSVIDHDMEKYPGVDREEMESEFNGHAAYTADLLLSKKIRKEFPSMERTVEAIRQYSELPDQLQRWVEMDEHLRDVLGAESPSSPADESPEPKKNTGPAGLTKSEAIQKAKKGGTGLLKHAEAVSATMIYLGTNSGQWSAVPVEDMVEVQDSKGNGRTVPQFATPKDYTHVETPWTASGAGGEFCCELCATPIKNAFQIQNDEKKWLMTVGSECVTKFGDGMSGEQLAKKDMQKKRRDLVKVSHEAIRGFAEKIREEKQGKNLTLQDVARAIGNDDSRKRFWNVAKSLGIDPYSTQWRIDKDGVVHDDDFKHLDGFATREKSTDQKISNWHKKNSETAEMMLKDLKRFGVDVDQYARRSSRLLSEAASSTHTSPTMAQREAGNYSKGIFPWKGLEIAIENPKGSERSGVSSSGREWSRVMASHYGYFRRTAANDGDNLDVFIGAHPDSDFVLVIKQVDQSGKFDEFKVVVGCLNRKEAKKLYLANYPAGWKCGPAASMTVDLFKEWIAKGGPMRAKSLAKVEC